MTESNNQNIVELLLKGHNIRIWFVIFISLILIGVFAGGCMEKPFYPVHVGIIYDSFHQHATLKGPNSIFISGNYAYVTSDSQALEVIDISDPTHPVHKGVIQNGENGAILEYPTKVFVLGNYAYVVTHHNNSRNGIEIVDISDPAHPVHEGTYINEDYYFQINGLFVSGNYAYIIGAKSPYFMVVNVTDPSHPSLMGAIRDGFEISGLGLNYPQDIFISGTNAYVTFRNYLEIIDISDPGHPVHKGIIHDKENGAFLDGPGKIYISGNYAYATSAGALEIIDVTDPSHPVHKGVIHEKDNGAVLSNPTSIFVSGHFAYVTNGERCALEIIDVSDPGNPVHRGVLYDDAFQGGGMVLKYPISVSGSGNYVYIVSRESNALVIFDISEPGNPIQKGIISDDPGGIQLQGPVRVSVAGNYAYVVSNYSKSLEIVDITDPTLPIHSRSILFERGLEPYDVSTSVNYGCVVLHDTIAIYNISDPTHPSQQYMMHTRMAFGDGSSYGEGLFYGAKSVFVSGNLAYVISQNNSLEIINLSSDGNFLYHPRHAGIISNGDHGAVINNPVSVFVSGNYAYVASHDSNALEIVDVSDPVHPVHRGVIHDGDNGAELKGLMKVFVSGNYAYIASHGSNALEIVDVSAPSHPYHKAVIRDGDNGAELKGPMDVFVSGNYAYVTSHDSNALEIIRVYNQTSDI